MGARVTCWALWWRPGATRRRGPVQTRVRLRQAGRQAGRRGRQPSQRGGRALGSLRAATSRESTERLAQYSLQGGVGTRRWVHGTECMQHRCHGMCQAPRLSPQVGCIGSSAMARGSLSARHAGNAALTSRGTAGRNTRRGTGTLHAGTGAGRLVGWVGRCSWCKPAIAVCCGAAFAPLGCRSRLISPASW